MRRLIQAAVCAAALLSAAPATAQLVDWTDRGFVNIGFGAQITGQDLTSSVVFDYLEEQATVTAARDVKGGVFFDAMAGARLWRNLGPGFSFSRRSPTTDATVTATIPDPIFHDEPRTVTGTVPDMKFSETLFAPLLIGGFPITDIIDAIGFIGPVIRSVDAEVLSGATVAEGPSGPTVTATRETIEKTFVGVQIGVDVRYLLTTSVGVGGFVRYTSGGGNLNDTVRLDDPGVQIGAGVRFKF
jgi:hypothetical protein